MSRVWKEQEAEAHFGELFEACLNQGRQVIARDGERIAVLVPIEEWRKLKREIGPSLKDLLLAPEPATERHTPKRRGS